MLVEYAEQKDIDKGKIIYQQTVIAPTDDRKLINRFDKRNNILSGPDLKTEALTGDKKVRF